MRVSGHAADILQGQSEVHSCRWLVQGLLQCALGNGVLVFNGGCGQVEGEEQGCRRRLKSSHGRGDPGFPTE